MSNVDDLIAELYPEMNATKPTGLARRNERSAPQLHEWDDGSAFPIKKSQVQPSRSTTTKDDWDDDEITTRKCTTSGKLVVGSADVTPAGRIRGHHNFDESSSSSGDEMAKEKRESSGLKKASARKIAVLPFSDALVQRVRCGLGTGFRCFLTNYIPPARMPSSHTHFVYQMNRTAEPVVATVAERIEERLAERQLQAHDDTMNNFVSAPSGGSIAKGCDDPCIFIQCRHCDHVVVRLQHAAWLDENGTRDLYLFVRNHYPDWRRFDGSVLSRLGPLNTERSGQTRESPLQAAEAGSCLAAAYMCQCAWFTCFSDEHLVDCSRSLFQKSTPPASPTTTTGPRVRYCTRDNSPNDEVDLIEGLLPPPPWVCKGHALQF